MRKIILEILISVGLIFIPTYFVYKQLESTAFWSDQFLWSTILCVCWIVVAFGYYHQGWLVRKNEGHAKTVSLVLPIAVFIVQCILFVKGIYYDDWSLIFGAVTVNSGVIYSLYHIFLARRKNY